MHSLVTNPVSIALATHNGASYIEEQLGSILAQSLPPEEIIVFDDHSTDDTIRILTRFEADGKIRLYRSEANLGVVRSFAKAVSFCKPNNIICLSDQDDVWIPTRIETSVRLLQGLETGDSRPALSFTDLALTDAGGIVQEPSFWRVLDILPEKENLNSLLFGNFVTGCTLAMNPAMRMLFEQMPVAHVTMHDAWVALIAFSFGSYAFTDEPTVLYRQHGSNVTGSTNHRQNIIAKISSNFRQIYKSGDYLKPQIEMAKAFVTAFEAYLGTKDRETLKKFIALEHAGWGAKKARSLIARRYRWQRMLNRAR